MAMYFPPLDESPFTQIEERYCRRCVFRVLVRKEL